MGKPVPPLDKQYANRAADIMSINLSMDREAVRLLRQYAPGPRAHGRFLSQLVFEYDRREEFQNLWEEARNDLRRLCRAVQNDMTRRENSDSK